jgi:hypothetical protein
MYRCEADHDPDEHERARLEPPDPSSPSSHFRTPHYENRLRLDMLARSPLVGNRPSGPGE